MANEVTPTQADEALAENHRRGIGGGYDREVHLLAADAAAHRIAHEAPLLARNAELEGALRKIERAPAWGAPDRWETTPAEVRTLARAALKQEETK